MRYLAVTDLGALAGKFEATLRSEGFVCESGPFGQVRISITTFVA